MMVIAAMNMYGGVSVSGTMGVQDLWGGAAVLSNNRDRAARRGASGAATSIRVAVWSGKHVYCGEGSSPCRVRVPGAHTHAPCPTGVFGRGSAHIRPGAQGAQGVHDTGEAPGAHVVQGRPGPGASNPGKQRHPPPGAHTPPLPQVVGQRVQGGDVGVVAVAVAAIHPGAHVSHVVPTVPSSHCHVDT